MIDISEFITVQSKDCKFSSGAYIYMHYCSPGTILFASI